MNTWASVTYTNPGLVRSHNEDALLDLGNNSLWAVADGMGGHEAGDYASQHVVESLMQYQSHARPGICMSRLKQLLRQSNEHLVHKAQQEQRGIIGCTLATLTLLGTQSICSWSGDSRVYRVRAGKLFQLTRDHSYGALLEDRNRLTHDQPASENAELLTAAIGGEETLHVEHCCYGLQPDDRFLLCTDGLYKEVDDVEIEAIINNAANAGQILPELAELYRHRGARDNIGMVYVYADA